MSDRITPEEARSQILAEEYSAQNSALISKVATLRVNALLLEQQVTQLRETITALEAERDEDRSEAGSHRAE